MACVVVRVYLCRRGRGAASHVTCTHHDSTFDPCKVGHTPCSSVLCRRGRAILCRRGGARGAACHVTYTQHNSTFDPCKVGHTPSMSGRKEDGELLRSRAVPHGSSGRCGTYIPFSDT